MSKKTEVNTEELVKEITGLSKSEAMDILVGKIGYAQAEKFWATNGAKTKAQGFRVKFYNHLKENDLNSSELVKEFITNNGGSDNDIKGYTHYLAIAELVAKVRNS